MSKLEQLQFERHILGGQAIGLLSGLAKQGLLPASLTKIALELVQQYDEAFDQITEIINAPIPPSDRLDDARGVSELPPEVLPHIH